MGKGRKRKGRGKNNVVVIVPEEKIDIEEKVDTKPKSEEKDTSKKHSPCQEELLCCLSCKRTEGFTDEVNHGKGRGKSSRLVPPCRYAAAKVQFYLSNHKGSWEEMLDLHSVKETTMDKIVQVLSEFDADRFHRRCGHAGLNDVNKGTVHCFHYSVEAMLEACIEETTKCKKFYPQNNVTSVAEGFVI